MLGGAGPRPRRGRRRHGGLRAGPGCFGFGFVLGLRRGGAVRAVLRGARRGGAGPLRPPHLLPLLRADAGAVRCAVLRRVP